MKIPKIPRIAPKKKSPLPAPPLVPPFLPGCAERFFIPELLGFVDADRDGTPDSLRIGITNIWMPQRLTGVALSIDGQALKGLKLRIDNGFAIFRADDIRLVRFEPGADFTITAEGSLPAQGPHRIDLVLSGAVADIAVRGIEIIVKEKQARFAFIDPEHGAAEELSSKPRLHLVAYTSFSSQHLRDPKEAARVGAGNLMEATHLCDKHEDFHFSLCGLAPARYLRSHDPDALAALRTLVEKGRVELIFSGPGNIDWAYAGGESIIRQLMRWQRFCRDHLGVIGETAWLTGDGGFPTQLPQILRKCGFKGILLRRSLPETKETSQILKAPDGGSVLAHSPSVGFDAAYPILDDDSRANDRFEKIVAATGGEATGETACIPSGTALGRPQERALHFLDKWNQKHPFSHLEFSTFGRFLASLQGRSLKEHRGFLAGVGGEFPAACPAFGQAAKTIESSLLELETIRLFDESGEKYCHCDEDSMKLWEHFESAQSQPIENELPNSASDPKLARLEKVGCFAKDLKREILGRLAGAVRCRPGVQTILIANTLGFPRRETVELDLRGALGKLPVIHDGARIIPTQILQSELYGDGQIKRARILALVDAPACGYRAYFAAAPSDDFAKPAKYFFPNARENMIENGFNKFMFDPKTGSIVSALDRKRDWTWHFRRGGLMWNASDKASLGTEKIPLGKACFQAYSSEVIENGPVRAAVKFHGRLSGKKATLTYRLCAGSRRLDIIAKFEGAMPDEAVCVDFNIKLSNPRYYADAPFEIREEPSEYFPVESFCELATSDRGAAFLHDGIPDWRTVGKGVRATLWSKTTSARAGKTDSKTLGGRAFRYAVYLHAGTFEKGGAIKRAAAFTRSLTAVGPVPGTQSDAGIAPMKSLLRVEPANIMLSSFFVDEKGRSVFRLWETSGQLCEARIIPGRPVHSIAVTDCLGREAKFYTPEAGVVHIPFRPREIKTCRLVFDQ
jgi:Glycosyl hydrolases family 38 N-terminal domain/Glycosyl hydrolases family 38 C-terminal domain